MHDWEDRMPEVKWEWKIGPSTLLQFAQLVAIIVAIFGGFLKMQSDINAQRESIETQRQALSRTNALITSMETAQSRTTERVTRVETKVDLILPTLQEIQRSLTGRPR